MAVALKKRVPKFSLTRQTKGGLRKVDVKFSDQKQTVILFFPLAFTPGCTEEMCQVSTDLKIYEKLDAKIYGISVDSPYSQYAWANKCKLKIPLLSDFNKKVSKLFGTLQAKFKGFEGVARRSAFVIDSSGVLVYRWIGDKDCMKQPPFKEIKSALEKSKSTPTTKKTTAKPAAKTTKAKAKTATKSKAVAKPKTKAAAKPKAKKAATPKKTSKVKKPVAKKRLKSTKKKR